MAINIKVQNFLAKHRSNITLAAHTDTALFAELERLFQEMYILGWNDGWEDARPEDEYTKTEIYKNA